MAFHHVALATPDIGATHAFYTDVMGFRLVRVVAARTQSGGWAKQLFYETGGDGLIAFWDLHDETVPKDFTPAIASGLGLPEWTNHIGFRASSLDEIGAMKERWLANGHDVIEVDHGWRVSIATLDPNGIRVELCMTTQALTDADVAEAQRRLAAPMPSLETQPPVRLHKALPREPAGANRPA